MSSPDQAPPPPEGGEGWIVPPSGGVTRRPLAAERDVLEDALSKLRADVRTRRGAASEGRSPEGP